jgi:hypothetical protein
MDYVSPIDERVRPATPLAPRPHTLAGRRVALLDISKARGDEFLARVAELLRKDGAEPWRIAKPAFSRPAPTRIADDVASRSDLVVVALAD